MATIISGRAASDGYDIKVRLSDKRPWVFHSQAGEPKDAQVFVDDCERKLFAVEAEQLRIAAIPVEPTLSQATDAQIRAEAEKRSIVIGALKP